MALFKWLERRREARRTAAAAEAATAAAAFEQFRAFAESRGAQVLVVHHVYQRARRGTKAIVFRLDGRNVSQETWFWWASVRNGDVLMVSAFAGYGPHTRNDNVFYAGSDHGGSGILSSFDPRTFAAARRHWVS